MSVAGSSVEHMLQERDEAGGPAPVVERAPLDERAWVRLVERARVQDATAARQRAADAAAAEAARWSDDPLDVPDPEARAQSELDERYRAAVAAYAVNPACLAGLRDRAEVDEWRAGPGLPEPDAAQWAAAEVDRWPGRRVDGDLVFGLERITNSAVADESLAQVVAAWQRVAAWAVAQSALAAAELSRRALMRHDVGEYDEVAGDELAALLGWSRGAGHRLVRDGRALGNELSPTLGAVVSGELTCAHLRVVCDRLQGVPGELSWQVQDEVLPEAGTCTPYQLGRRIERALMTIEPEDAAARAAAARERRRVSGPIRLPDGMAGLRAVLPAVDAVRIDQTLEQVARAAHAGGDPRTLHQLRADVFAALLLGRGQPDDEAATSAAGGTGSTGPVRVDVTIAASSLLGLDELPAHLAGYGPIDPVTARALAVGGVWRRIVTDDLSGTVLDVGRTRYRPPADMAEHVRVRDRTCVFPGCGMPARRADLDHTIDFFAHGNRGDTGAGNLGPLCRAHHQLKTVGAFTLRQSEPGRFEWTSPLGLRYLVEVRHGEQHVTRAGPAPLTHEPNPTTGAPDDEDDPPPF